jgi:predicted amidohydrolase
MFILSVNFVLIEKLTVKAKENGAEVISFHELSVTKPVWLKGKKPVTNKK